MTNHHKELQDKLLLDMLDLIEQSVKCKINIENSNNNGQLFLAKARYCQGSQTAAVSKLPTEHSAEFNALRTVELKDDEELELQKNTVDKENGFIDPIKWFGILVPRSLQLAQEKYQSSVQFVVEAANIQLKLHKTISNMLALRNV